MDPYEVLGISRDASPEQVKEAYRVGAQLYHPDRLQDYPEAVRRRGEENLKQLNAAYTEIQEIGRRKYAVRERADHERAPQEQPRPQRGAASMNELTGCTQRLTELTIEIGKCFSETAPQLRQATTPGKRLAIFNKQADQLAPLVARYQVQASNYQRLVLEVNEQTQASLRTIRDTPRQQWGDAIPRYMKSIKQFAEAGLAAVDASRKHCESLGRLKGNSPRLDQTLLRLQRLIAMGIACQAIFKSWLQELEDLNSQGCG